MKKILYFDLDGVLADYKSAEEKLPKDLLSEYGGKAGRIPGFFLNLKPFDDALEAFRKLSLNEKFDIYILSTASWTNAYAWAEKVFWVKKHLPDFEEKRLILTHNKQLNRGDFLIDDREENGAKEFGEHGKTGKWIHFKGDDGEFPTWDAIVKYLEGQVQE